eukprot:gnl/Hemi2/10796_TR3697_c0_g1_i1.p1 gnl/Hemi2/10796_TR3697_c0_g1~~gnl/Hemi2/10796_TR3697_c0_g1_i1.p1  ORF type:complete len:352 (+),score=71.79 gnl/Hemi2/10796_TR3697_c0_g1_i1:86-1141(+)
MATPTNFFLPGECVPLTLFVSAASIPPSLVCSLCSNIMAFPVKVRCAALGAKRHRFGQSCVFRHLKLAAPACPFHNVPLLDTKNTPLDLSQKACVDGLAIKCSNNGCQWVGRYKDLTAHMNVCGTELIPCPNKCGAKIARAGLAHHWPACPRLPESPLMPVTSADGAGALTHLLQNAEIEARTSNRKDPAYAHGNCRLHVPQVGRIEVRYCNYQKGWDIFAELDFSGSFSAKVLLRSYFCTDYGLYSSTWVEIKFNGSTVLDRCISGNDSVGVLRVGRAWHGFSEWSSSLLHSLSLTPSWQNKATLIGFMERLVMGVCRYRWTTHLGGPVGCRACFLKALRVQELGLQEER